MTITYDAINHQSSVILKQAKKLGFTEVGFYEDPNYLEPNYDFTIILSGAKEYSCFDLVRLEEKLSEKLNLFVECVCLDSVPAESLHFVKPLKPLKH